VVGESIHVAARQIRRIADRSVLPIEDIGERLADP
jgi:hypothetical protein